MMAINSLNLISFHHASSVREAAHTPMALPDATGRMKSVPCVMDAVDKLEAVKLELGDSFQSSLRTTGPARTFDFHISADKNPETIDSSGEMSTGSGPMSKEQLAGKIVSSFRKDAFNVVHVRAHGHAHEDIMGMPTNEFVAGLHLASKELGGPIPALLLESCLMSSLDVLSSMAGSVQTVIASQEVLEANALPHGEMFGAAIASDMSPRKVAERMVSAAGRHGKPDTLTAFDPNKLVKVEKTVESLKKEMDQEPLDKSLRKSIRKNRQFPHRSVETSCRKRLDLRDLGTCLEAISDQSESSKIKNLALEANSALETATLARASGKGYESLSGLSVRTESVTEQAGWRLSDLWSFG